MVHISSLNEVSAIGSKIEINWDILVMYPCLLVHDIFYPDDCEWGLELVTLFDGYSCNAANCKEKAISS